MKKKELLTIGLMMFSLFFGAGNLIFPPMMGKEAGTNIVTTMLFFSITAIILPILSVIAVSKFDGLKNLSSRVDKFFAIIFTVVVALSIGPALAIPRTGTVPFEIGIAPYLPENFSVKLALFIFTSLFFGITYILSQNPSNLPQILGKITSPILIILICLLFVGSLINPMGNYQNPVEKYETFYGIQGILDGYLTLDVMAGLNYGLVISYVIKAKNITEKNEITKLTLKVGLIAGIVLFIIYSMLSHIGASSALLYSNTKNGAEILTLSSKYIYGTVSVVLISLIFTTSCLGVSIGLTVSLSQYFSTLVKKISYKKWVLVWVLLSFGLANMGLNKIMSYSVPLLMATYPTSIVLTLLALIDEKIKGNTFIYKITVYLVTIVSFIAAFDGLGIIIPILTNLVRFLPLYNLGLSWISVSIVSFFVSYLWIKMKK